MAKIVLRFLTCFVLIVNLIIYITSYLTGINIYKTYGKQILKAFGTLILFIIALYITFAFLGIN